MGSVLQNVPSAVDRREEILEYNDEAAIDLTVIGSKHRSGEYRRLLGSFAQVVAKVTQRPATIVKTPVEAA